MKITITVELDQEATQMIANPLESISQKITNLIESFEKHSQVIKATPEESAVPPNEIKEDPIHDRPVQTQEPANSISDRKNIRKSILEAIKSKKTGFKAKQIQEITGFTGKQISNNIFHLKKAKLVRKTPKGFFVYIPPQEPSINSDLD
ncbi:hypothetical protein HRM2_12030 [Desulforapulum autotrophicum HRM2]|uniref:Uncharacterized protein n=1 Tax=Desulforapulum autotrophicum (strain ATCC 43914 / DSM 3382 / VKM B-1955 / HRM2) TaxID=177437 RepID=C0QM09_DESAH|nr:hypothetical protein [Desulforapulum autotrophicum]ACN14315.1 hypothetical protein HRM2_12030 [Desulforapulum autotrophicum HRM2]